MTARSAYTHSIRVLLAIATRSSGLEAERQEPGGHGLDDLLHLRPGHGLPPGVGREAERLGVRRRRHPVVEEAGHGHRRGRVSAWSPSNLRWSWSRLLDSWRRRLPRTGSRRAAIRRNRYAVDASVPRARTAPQGTLSRPPASHQLLGVLAEEGHADGHGEGGAEVAQGPGVNRERVGPVLLVRRSGFPRRTASVAVKRKARTLPPGGVRHHPRLLPAPHRLMVDRHQHRAPLG